MKHFQSIIAIICAMFAFAMMAYFTRQANTDILTIATWRAMLVSILFFVAAFINKELLFFSNTKDKDENKDENNNKIDIENNAIDVNSIPKDLSQMGLFSNEHLKISIPYGIFLGVASSTFVGGYALTTIANTIFLHNLAILFTIPLLYWKLSEKTNSNVMLGAIVSLVGVGCISGVSIFHATHFTNPRFLIGDMFAMASAIGYAGVLVWTQICRKHNMPILGTLFVAWSIAALILMIITLFLGSFAISLSVFLWILALAGFSTFLPFVLLSQGMKKISAGLASLLSMTEVLFATLLGILMYHETLAPIGWFGGLLVSVGILYPLCFPEQQNTKDTEDSNYPTSKTWVKIRNFRIVFWIFVLNLSVYFGIMEGELFLSVAILLVLFHLSQPSIAALLDYRYPKMQHIATSIFGLVVLVLLWMVLNIVETHESVPAISIWSLLLISILIDRYLQQQEQQSTEEQVQIYLQKEGDIQPYLYILLLSGIASIYNHSFSYFGQIIFSLIASYVVIERVGLLWNLGSRHKASRIRMPKSPNFYIVFGIFAFGIGGVYVVPTGHQALIERLGIQQDIVNAGLVFRIPPPFETLHIIDVKKTVSVDIFSAPEQFLCADQSMISINGVMEYTIEDVPSFEYQSINPRTLLLKFARNTIVEESRQISYEEIFQDRGILEASWKSKIQQKLTDLNIGIHIESLYLTQITVPIPVKDSFLDVVSAKEDQSTFINHAQADAASSLPLALGESVVINEKAQAQSAFIIQDAKNWSLIQLSKLRTSETKSNLYLDWQQQTLYRSDLIKNPIIKPQQSNPIEIEIIPTKQR